jgi:glycerol-3-phosphate dehydrogenase
MNAESVETLVIGGGITGACFFHVAARRGREVLLVERGDFASGTSQASGMMIWGGLLYLKNLEFKLVRKFSRSRDRLLARRPDQADVRRIVFLPLLRGGRPGWFVWAGLQLYRALSNFRRGPVLPSPCTAEELGFRGGRFARGWSYEEGFLRSSDALFCLDWLVGSGRFERALNHTLIASLTWDGQARLFHVVLRDSITGRERKVEARRVVNCAGPWADSVNKEWGVSTSTRHHHSKGVYLLLRNAGDEQALAMEMEHEGDALCWVPWGPVAMWGPTETDITHPDEGRATTEDVDFLLERLNRNSARRWTRDDILNVRVGTRPLALPPGRKVSYSLDLSRRAILEEHPEIPWSTAFGGKLSGALDFAILMHERIHGDKIRPNGFPVAPPRARPTTRENFGGMSLVDPAWCRDHEACRTLEDYLRRRTNAGQWIAHGGIGRSREHLGDLARIASILHPDDLDGAKADLDSYIQAQDDFRRSWNHG